MNDAKVNETFKSVAQCTRFVYAVAGQIAKQLEGQAENSLVQSIVASPDAIESIEAKQIIEEVVTRILQIKVDPWKREKEKIEKFYAKHFGIKSIGWGKCPIPTTDIPGMKVLEFFSARVTEDQIFAAYKKEFGEDEVYKAYNSISKVIQVQQDRPKEDYCGLHKGGDEPDAEHLNDTYDMFSADGNTYMVPKEGMIAAFRYRIETGKMYDMKGLTRFHALDSYGFVVGMCKDNKGRWNIGGGNREHSYSGSGPRQLVF